MQNNSLRSIVILFVILAVALFAIFFFVIYQPGAGMYVRANSLTEQPDRYMELTSEELEKYP